MLSKLLRGLLYALPFCLFCSYHPIISLGATASMNLELSLPLLWLVLFDLVGLAGLLAPRTTFYESIKRSYSIASQKERPVKTGARLGSHKKLFWLTSLFPLFATLSIFWSPNPLRALLTAGIIWLLFIAIFIILFLIPLLKLPKNFAKNLLSAFFIASAAACLICWAQCFFDLAGFTREQTLLCAGCTYRSFGFPHPSGLAIEPQFMGNLLLAPTLTALYLLIFRKTSHKNLLLALASFFSLTLFITFSRGAIYAFIIALFILLLFALKNLKHHQPVSLAPLFAIPIITFFSTLAIQGLFAQISPTPETFFSGIDKSIDQLSLGIIDLMPSEAIPEDSSTPPNEAEEVYFDGYVAESTNVRLSLSETALKTWLRDPLTVLFGTGLGGAGTAMYQAFPDAVGSPKEIVQNQPISILLELGLVGSALALLGLVLAFFAPWQYSAKISKHFSFSLARHPALPLLLALILAYIATLQFFAGLPNALHIYLLPPLLYLIFQSKNTNKYNNLAKNPCQTASSAL